MKVALIAVLSLISLVTAENIDVSIIAKKIDTLQESRNIPAALDYDVYDPFLKAKPLLAQKEEKPVVTTQRAIVVQTILNKKALIDGRWIGVGDHLHGGATLTAVNDNHIVISKNRKVSTIFLKAKKSIITTKERSQ